MLELVAMSIRADDFTHCTSGLQDSVLVVPADNMQDEDGNDENGDEHGTDASKSCCGRERTERPCVTQQDVAYDGEGKSGRTKDRQDQHPVRDKWVLVEAIFASKATKSPRKVRYCC